MIAREGLPFIVIGVVLTSLFLYGALRWDNKLLFALVVFFGVLTLFTTFFFRDPERHIAVEPYQVVAPGDGKILSVDTLSNHSFIEGEAIKISIFLSVFDVHINRIPVSGYVSFVSYNPGKFFPAFRDKASEYNEQTEIGIITENNQRVAFKQIAGIIARRIVCRLHKGDMVTAGEKFGMIRFGSRVELFLPQGSEITIKPGDKVKGGMTVVGRLPETTPLSDSVQTAEGENVEL